MAAQGSKGIESKGVCAQRFQRLRLSSFSLNKLSLWEPERSQHGQQKSCQTARHTLATKGSWGFWPTAGDKLIFLISTSEFFCLFFFFWGGGWRGVWQEKENRIKAKNRERKFVRMAMSWSIGAQEDHTWRQEEDTEKKGKQERKREKEGER